MEIPESMRDELEDGEEDVDDGLDSGEGIESLLIGPSHRVAVDVELNGDFLGEGVELVGSEKEREVPLP